MAERVSGQRRRLAVGKQLRGSNSGRPLSPAKERATAPRFPFPTVSVDLRISHCLFPWQGEITGRQVTKRNLIDGITKKIGI